MQQGKDTISQLRRVLKRQKKDNDKILSLAHEQIDRQIEEFEDTKQESKSQAGSTNEARLELSVHRQSHGAAQQATYRVRQGIELELISQESNEMLLVKLNVLRKTIHQCTGHTMNKIQVKKNIDVSKVCNILQGMTTQLDRETAKAVTSCQCEEPVDYARIAERQADALRGIQDVMFTRKQCGTNV